ncbi:hypothetical protein M422DRAFT_261613 [Sphaerobolus stellatus SS14]|uniref:RNA helicase n=1 Tax=Sphaerobolus stellatus (strain SS14) TaxID=990650 RepID=A0A0C9VEM2_SPHS4|nr:hypothetical protein M422DRAFT_261613 [Sphaerobolus stellatus SS14]
MSKAVEKRMWRFEHPLHQLNLSQDVLYNLQRWGDELSVAELTSVSTAELRLLIRMNENHGAAILKAAKQYPALKLGYHLRALSADLLEISLDITKDFDWNTGVHGSSEAFWMWVEDRLDVDFIIGIRGSQPPPSVTIRYIADRWMGAEAEIIAVFDDELTMLSLPKTHTPLLNLAFLPLADSLSSNINRLYFRVFNGAQTQTFWPVMHTNQNILICAPASSGKSTMATLSACQTISKASADSFTLVIVPNRSQAKEIVSLYRLFQGQTWLPIDTIFYANVLTVVCEDLQLLDAVYEYSVSLLIHERQALPIRMIELSYCLNDLTDLAAWLHVSMQAMFSFRPLNREQSLTVSVVGFTIPHSGALFKGMSKAAYTAITEASPDENVLLFVPSRSGYPAKNI